MPDQLKKLIASLTVRQRISIALAAVLIGVSLFAFTRWIKERDFKPLYTSLASGDAGAVVERLRESGVQYRLSEDGSTILVPSAKVAETRLQMAAAGLPKTGRIGYELFDKTNLGTTDFAEHINYRRALEGELERSIMALSEVEQARVHVTFQKDSIFLESREPAKASVMLKIKSGVRLSRANVTAVSHLVASAVEGLAPDYVSIVDMHGNLLSRPHPRGAGEGEEPSEGVLLYRQSIEKDLLAKINSTLEPLLGERGFRAGASVEVDFSSGEQSEEVYDPAKSVMVSSQTTEDISQGGASAGGGVPGTASNLPRPNTRPPAGAGAGVSRRTESISYQSSRTVKRVRLPQGAVKRVSLAILVDHTPRWEGSGARSRRVLEAPSPEKLKVIRDVVAAATGFSPERGDQLVVESLPFESTLQVEPPAAAPAPERGPGWTLPALPPAVQEQLVKYRIGIAIGFAVLLALGAAFLFLRRRKRGRTRKAELAVQTALPAAEPGASPAAVQPAGGGASTAAPIDVAKQLESQIAENEAERERQQLEAIKALKLPPGEMKKVEVLVRHLGDTVQKEPVQAAKILRSWLYEER